jgi:cob(I)alamin adenosyltransferase
LKQLKELSKTKEDALQQAQSQLHELKSILETRENEITALDEEKKEREKQVHYLEQELGNYTSRQRNAEKSQ